MATMSKSDKEEIDPDYEQAFPARLHYLLDVLEKDGLGHLCSFQSHGRAFVVRDKAAFVKDILPKWFRQSRWASFQRQLNHYEFQRITTGPDQGAYYHPHFVRGIEHRDRCRFIRRIKVKGSGPRKPSNPATEPNFYKDPNVGRMPDRSLDGVNSLSKAKPSVAPSVGRTTSLPVGKRVVGLASGPVSECDYASLESKVANHQRMKQDARDSSELCSAAWMMTRATSPPSWDSSAAMGMCPPPRSLDALLLSAAARRTTAAAATAAATMAVAGVAPHPLLSKLRVSRQLLALAAADAAMAAAMPVPADLGRVPFRPTMPAGQLNVFRRYNGLDPVLHRSATAAVRPQDVELLALSQVASSPN